MELSFTVCLFNYFTRFVEGLHLPVEPWVKNTLPSPPKDGLKPNPARVALFTDLEMEAGQRLLEQAKSPSNPASSLGLGIANSQRAMFRVPELGAALGETSERSYAKGMIPYHAKPSCKCHSQCRWPTAAGIVRSTR